MLVSVGLRVPEDAIASNKDVGAHTKMRLTSGTARSAQPASPKELRLSKSGSNPNTQAGYVETRRVRKREWELLPKSDILES